MQTSHYFLYHLAKALDEKLRGATLIECFSQSKDELILGFNLSDQNDFFFKAHLSSVTSCLAFEYDFKRSNRNSVDLFNHLVNTEVAKVRVHENERVFSLFMTNGEVLSFKLFGKFSNVLNFDKSGKVVNLFNHQFEDDWKLDFSNLDRPIEKSFAQYERGGLKTVFPTFGKELKTKLESDGFEQMSIEDQWGYLNRLEMSLFHADRFYLNIDGGAPVLSFFKGEEVELETEDVLRISSQFFYAYLSTYRLKQEKAYWEKQFRSELKKAKSYQKKTIATLDTIMLKMSYQQLGDILMANLHHITNGISEVELDDFYNGGKVKIKLNQKLSPQKNAENYYRKQKNQHVEIKKLQENIDAATVKIKDLEAQVELLSNISDLRVLRKTFKNEKTETTEEDLFKRFQKEGFVILVGRNSKNNDLLTLKYAHKEDYWLHAKDVPGSHVVVKLGGKKEVSKSVLHFAASLAAYYSKRKNDTLCPVTLTRKKFVRKPKGLPPGAVMVDKEEVLLVEPREK